MIAGYDGLFTHLPVLATLIERTKGDVLECGVGWYSTPLIHLMLQGTERRALSLDYNPYPDGMEWIKQMSVLASPTHAFAYMAEGWIGLPDILIRAFDVVLLDIQPECDRKPVLKMLRDAQAQPSHIIVHDSNAEQYGFADVIESFRYRWQYKSILYPHTAVVSNVAEFNP